jgi:hypothetical protein
MVEKQKPEYDIVKKAAQAIKDPKTATPEDIKRFAARILNDEKNAPTPNKTIPKPRPKPSK